MSPIDVPNWRMHQASPGDTYQVSFLASRSATNSDLDQLKTVLSQRPDVAVQGITAVSPMVVRVDFRELGTEQLGAQLGSAAWLYVSTPGEMSFTPMSVVQTGGSTAWSRFLASADATSQGVSTGAGNSLIQATNAIHKVEASLPSLGRDALIAGALVAALVAFAYGASRKL